MSWHFTAEKIGARIEEIGRARVRLRQALEPLAIIKGTREHGPASDGESAGTVAAGGTYRAAEQTVTLRGSVTIPETWAGQRVFLALEFGGAETLVYVDGKPVQAIDHQHHDLLLADPAEGGRTYDLALAAYTGTVDAQKQGGWSGAGGASIADDQVEVALKIAELQWIDRAAEALFYDMHVAFESAKTMDSNSREYLRSWTCWIRPQTSGLPPGRRRRCLLRLGGGGAGVRPGEPLPEVSRRPRLLAHPLGHRPRAH